LPAGRDEMSGNSEITIYNENMALVEEIKYYIITLEPIRKVGNAC